MRIYLAGPMRGLDDFNFQAFDAARDLLCKMGHEVVSPADFDRQAGTVREVGGRVVASASFSFKAALRRDLAAICACDAVAFLPGWELSEGELIERRMAIDVGCRLYRLDPQAGVLAPEIVVGLAGYARSGKDTAAGLLAARHGFARGSFAGTLKRMLLRLDPLVANGTRLSDVARDLDTLEDAKAQLEVRQLLQRLGTEAGRHVLGEDVWVDALLERAPCRLVVSDVRYPNEADAIKARKGYVVRITRPGYAPVNSHVSETALDDYSFDALVVNDGTIDDLAAQLDSFVDRFLLAPQACSLAAQ